MVRIFALVAAVGMAASVAGTAGAHPPDLYGSYGNSYESGYKYEVPINTQPYYGGGYGGSSYTAAPSYSGVSYGSTYAAPTYSAPTYGASSYVSPSYTTQGYGQTYGTPSYSYGTPSYSAPAYSAPAQSYTGYATPGYGYRHRRGGRYHRGTFGVRNPYANYPVSAYGHRGFGPLTDIPTTEGFNVGYAGGPTFGTDQNPVVNGVRLNAAPN